jgi:hypothetical protein
VTPTPPPSGSPTALDAGQETVRAPHPEGHIPWVQAGISLASLGTPIGIGITHPLFAAIATAIELAVALTITGTACSGARQ